MVAKEVCGKFKITEVGSKIKITLLLDEYSKELMVLEWGKIPKSLIKDVSVWCDEELTKKMEEALLSIAKGA